MEECAVCGECKEMTFEHIPPKGVGNYKRMYLYTGIEVIQNKLNELPYKMTQKNYEPFQKGMGGYYLCEKCNNTLGGKYVEDYIFFNNSICSIVNILSLRHKDKIRFKLKIKPLNILKHLVSNYYCLAKKHGISLSKSCKNFIFDVNNKELPIKLNIELFLSLNKFSKFNMMFNINVNLKNIYSSKQPELIGNLVYYPLGVNFYEDSSNNYGYDISHFLNYSYDEEVEIPFTLTCVNNMTLIPGDYRSNLEINLQNIETQIESTRKNNIRSIHSILITVKDTGMF